MKGYPSIVLLLALGSIGAKDCAPVGLSSTALYCHTDPPVGCAAYCSAVDTVTFTPACSHVSAGDLELVFEAIIMSNVAELEAAGRQACPPDELFQFVTPCHVGITPQEWPNQDHAVCTPAPPGCPLY